jgi:diacylglycerol kinase (ATP)
VARGERVLIVHNPSAGRGRAARCLAELTKTMGDAGIAYDVVSTRKSGDGVALAARGSQEGYAIIVAAGGDGTINEVINGMALAAPESETIGPIGVYPIGGGNDLAHSLQLEADATALAYAIQNKIIRHVDLGLATVRSPTGEVQRYFHNSLGYGLEASVTQESNRIRNLSGGVLYLVAAFRALQSYATPRTVVKWIDEDGRAAAVEQEITLLSIGNARRTGGGFYLTPEAQVDDDLFDVAMAGAMSRIRLLSLLPRALLGKHTGAKSVHMLRCRQIVVKSEESLPVHMDGEVVMADAIEAEAVVQPRRLAILA